MNSNIDLLGLSGGWAMESNHLRELMDRLRAMDASAIAAAMAKLRAAEGEDGDDEDENEKILRPFRRKNGKLPDHFPAGVEAKGNVAIVSLTGPLTKDAGLFTALFGGTATSDVAAAIRAVDAEPSIEGILMRVDSPGGQAAAAPVLFDAIRAAQKPVIAFADGMAASAAYWCAAAANQIIASPMSLMGSIGTVMTLVDSSEAAKQAGLQIHVVSSAPLKGAGTPGSKVTDAQLADAQRLVNDMNSHFIDAVAAGRGKVLNRAKVEQLADGRIHLGGQAKALGLADLVGSFDDALAAVRESIANRAILSAPSSGGRRQAMAGRGIAAEVAAAASAANTSDPVARYEALVDGWVRRGMNRTTAIATVDRQYPEAARLFRQTVRSQFSPRKIK